jgi:hypothetical protein
MMGTADTFYQGNPLLVVAGRLVTRKPPGVYVGVWYHPVTTTCTAYM